MAPPPLGAFTPKHAPSLFVPQPRAFEASRVASRVACLGSETGAANERAESSVREDGGLASAGDSSWACMARTATQPASQQTKRSKYTILLIVLHVLRLVCCLLRASLIQADWWGQC